MIEDKYDTSKVMATNNDKFICKYIFRQLDKEKKAIVSKEELLDFLVDNEVVRNNFKIDSKWLYSDLEGLDTKRKGLLTAEETTKFLI